MGAGYHSKYEPPKPQKIFTWQLVLGIFLVILGQALTFVSLMYMR